MNGDDIPAGVVVPPPPAITPADPTRCPVSHRPHDCRKPGACLTATLAALDNAGRLMGEADRFDRETR